MHSAFAESKPISTCLIAFAAGPWTVLHSDQGTRTVSIFVRRSRAAEVERDTLLVTNQRALDWMEHYFDRPYLSPSSTCCSPRHFHSGAWSIPLGNLDQAKSNYGAIVYNKARQAPPPQADATYAADFRGGDESRTLEDLHVLLMPVGVIAKAPARSLIEASPPPSRSRMPRRVRSESAANAPSS